MKVSIEKQFQRLRGIRNNPYILPMWLKWKLQKKYNATVMLGRGFCGLIVLHMWK